MNKHLTYIVPVLVLILILVIALHFTTIEKLDREAPTIIETVHKPDTVIVQIIPSFLKNTTYIYSNHQKYGNKEWCMLSKNLKCNRGRMEIKRIISVMANKELRKKYFGF